MNDMSAYALGSHVRFLPEGTAFTSPGAGNVAVDDWPDADEPTLNDYNIGDVEDWSDKKNVETEEVFKPNPGILTRKDIITFFQSLDLEFTTNSLRRIAMQIMYGSAVTLTEGVGEFVPLAAEPPKGLLLIQRYTQENELVFMLNIWARVDLQEAASGNKKLVKPKFMVKMLDSDLNYGFFGDEDLL